MIIKVGGGLEPLGPIGVYAYECAVVYVLVGSYSMRPERERRNQLVGRLAGLWDV